MVNVRRTVLAAAVVLGSISGCTSCWTPGSLWARLRGCHDEACCDVEGSVGVDGPILGECGPGPALPPGAVPVTPAPNGTIPAPNPPGRLVPQPQGPAAQANPMPYTPG